MDTTTSKNTNSNQPYAIAGIAVLGLLFLASTWFFVKSSILLQQNANQLYSSNTATSSETNTKKTTSPKYNDPLVTMVPDEQQSTLSKTKVFVSTLDPLLGTTEAKVYVILFANFGDSQTQTYLEYIDRLKKEFGDDVAFVWKEYIPSDDDERVVAMSTFAHCANEQLLFWEYAKALGARTADDDSTLYQIAESVGADRYTAEDCVVSGGFQGIFKQGFYTAEQLGVKNAHTVFINDDMYADVLSYEELESKIRTVLDQY